jgi:hypothetical protein
VNDPGAATASRRAASAAALLNLVGMVLDALYWRHLQGALPGPHLVSALVGAASFALLFLWRTEPPAWLGSVVFLVNNAAILATLWWSDEGAVRSTTCWTAFDPQKLGALTVALLAPPRLGVGLVSIAGFALVPVAEYLHWTPALRANLAQGGPFATVIYGLFACALFAHQRRHHALQRQLARAGAEAEAMQRFARMVLAVRDLSNTPLQTIQLTVALLRARGTFDVRLVDRLHRASVRLTEIGRVLERHELEDEQWRQGDASFDPLHVLAAGSHPGTEPHQE